MLPNPPFAGGPGAAFHRPAPLQPVPPQPRPAAKHVIDLSEDLDAGAYPLTSAAKRRRTRGDGRATEAKADKSEGGKGKGKARINTPLLECDGRANSKLQEDGWRLDDDGDMLILDDFDSLQPKAGTSAGGGDYFAKGKHAALSWEAGVFSKAASRADDPLDDSVATILAIIPDVAPIYVRDLLRMPLYGLGNVELVIEALLNDEQYPKKDEAGGSNANAKAKGKGKAREVEATPEASEEEDDAEVRRQANVWMDSSMRKPLGKVYEDAALAQLYFDFNSISQANLKRLFQSNSSFYVPTYIAAEKALKQTDAERGFKLMVGNRVVKGKGKVSGELEKEKQWLAEGLVRLRAAEGRAARLAKQLEEEIASGAYVECGCCFSDTAISQLIICSEGCQFCKDCVIMNAESQIGMRKYILPCMSTSGCSSTFPESEIDKCLPRKSLQALHKIRQEKEVDLAELEGLEKCPFCPFAYIIENDQERLFYCQREDCGIVSCRQCKKKDHLPKTCKEVSEDAKIDSIHRIEGASCFFLRPLFSFHADASRLYSHLSEAMSAALIRRCPKPGCNEPYIKEVGTCNKCIGSFA
ncbi:SPOSA6832_02302 [Sporobolomyces salmonicolor]|uniref:SPOSA6832_02302-mRNA-1:cds n=1 Tax=Sporidiobolus salmonicolor TaxID=5005 RepID=A0A0D6EL35_SPOSA|nr:SPOSA6832_02302 [Sporobolomyces salmonicolor]